MLPDGTRIMHSRSANLGNAFFQLLRVIPLLLLLSATALADYQIGTLFTRPGWDYAASVIYEGTVEKFWWCGSGYISGYSGQTDVIYYRSYDLNTGQWSAIYQVISPVVGSWEFNGGSGTCNPTIVKGSFSPGDGNTYAYALYYTAQNDTVNKIGVAFSHDGITFVKYSANPIVYPIKYPAPSNTGAVSLSSWQDSYYGSSAVYLFEYDDSGGGGLAWWRYAADGIHFGSASLYSTSSTFGPIAAMNDVAYDTTTQTFYGVTESAFRPGDREGWTFGFYKIASSELFSGGSGTWQLLGIVDTNLTNSYLNLQAKLLRNGQGNINTSVFPSLEAYFSRGTNDPSTWDLSWVVQDAQPSTYPFNRYYDPYIQPIGDHWVTTGSVSAGYNLEFTMGYLYMSPQAGTAPLYSCLAIYDHFVSLHSNCENWTVVGINGWIYSPYSGPPVGVSTTALYRCSISAGGGTDHFVSTSPSCEGWHMDYLLGYAKSQP